MLVSGYLPFTADIPLAELENLSKANQVVLNGIRMSRQLLSLQAKMTQPLKVDIFLLHSFSFMDIIQHSK